MTPPNGVFGPFLDVKMKIIGQFCMFQLINKVELQMLEASGRMATKGVIFR